MEGRLQGLSGYAFRGLPQPPRFDQLPLTGDPLFDGAIRVVFQHEGFWSDDPDDPGGPTIWGVSLRWARSIGDLDGDGFADLDLDRDGDVDADDLRRLTADQALHLYRRLWWDRYGYARLPELIAIKTFDLAVNMGASQAHKLLQRAVRACSGYRLIEDGIIGSRTLTAVRDVVTPALLAALRSEAAGFYRLLASRRPASAKYEAGWLNRAYY